MQFKFPKLYYQEENHKQLLYKLKILFLEFVINIRNKLVTNFHSKLALKAF